MSQRQNIPVAASSSASPTRTTFPPRRKPQSTGVGAGELVGNGRYKIEGRVGTGCFSEVFRAWDHVDQCIVALKISSDADSDAAGAARRELNSLKALSHPNVVVYREDLQWSHLGTSFQVIVQGFCDAGTLKERVENKNLSLKDALRITEELGAGLAYIHGRGVIHGDLKCSNILFDQSGAIRIADFGSSQPMWPRALDDNIMSGGDLWYLPPEANQSGSLRPAYDMWSVGLIVSEMVTLSLIPAAYPNACPISAHPKVVSQLLRTVRSRHDGRFLPLAAALLLQDPTGRLSAPMLSAIAGGLQTKQTKSEDPPWRPFLLKLWHWSETRWLAQEACVA